MPNFIEQHPRQPSRSIVDTLALQAHRHPTARTAIVPAEYARPWQYQLQTARSLPVLDLCRTPSSYLPVRWRIRLLRWMGSRYRYLMLLYRIVAATFLLVLVLPPSPLRTSLTLITLTSLPTFGCTIAFLSIDMLRILAKLHETWFISVVNTLNWTLLAYMLGDLRVVACFVSWLGMQIVVVIDANFRTYPGMMRSIALSIPAMLSISTCCALDLVHDPRHQRVTVGALDVPLPNLLMFTSSTLSIFMGKIVILKRRRQHASLSGFKVIPCVIFRARMRLRISQPIRRTIPTSHCHDALQRNRVRPHVQRVLLSKLAFPKVDALYCVVPKSTMLTDEPISWMLLAPFYAVGGVGFVTLMAASGIVLRSPTALETLPVNYRSLELRVLLVTSTLASVFFCGTFTLQFQRDLLHALLFNFDYMFSSFQIMVLALCIADILHWGERCLVVLGWWIWTQWILSLDALTPLAKRRFRFRRIMVLPAMLTIMVNIAWLFVLIALIEATATRFRVLIHYELSSQQQFEITTTGLAMERIVTLLAWLGTRLLLAFAVRDEDELVFVHGHLEYTSPFEMLPRTAVAPDDDPLVSHADEINACHTRTVFASSLASGDLSNNSDNVKLRY